MKLHTTLLFLLLGAFYSVDAQDDDFLFIDNTYVENIRTVRFGPEGFQERFPLISLNEGGQLLLSFDDLDTGVKDYVYTIIHCDRNWERTNLAPLEYINGFEEEDIQFYDFSFLTLKNFTYYEFLFPNDNINVTKSGNYLLVIYEDEEDKFPVITRRFVVADRSVNIATNVMRPSVVSKIHTHQEIDFTVNHQKLNSRNPKMELRAAVLQNGRWDNAITDIEPRFTRPDEAIFDYQDKIIFEGGNEFRFIDLRSLQAPQSDIDYVGVNELEQRVEAELVPLVDRAYKAHLSYADLNGSYIIENFDRNDAILNSEYVYVMVTYQPQNLDGKQDIYLFGEITEWQLKEEYRMRYNDLISSYVGRFPFKQGYHNYLLATIPPGSSPKVPPSVDTKTLEGSHSDTENEYQILIYYRPFGSRYDQVVGASIINTNAR